MSDTAVVVCGFLVTIAIQVWAFCREASAWREFVASERRDACEGLCCDCEGGEDDGEEGGPWRRSYLNN